jgi:hypothetical protein
VVIPWDTRTIVFEAGSLFRPDCNGSLERPLAMTVVVKAFYEAIPAVYTLKYKVFCGRVREGDFFQKRALPVFLFPSSFSP